MRRREEEKLAEQLAREPAAAGKETLRAEAGERLRAGEAERRQEINRLVLEVMSEALKEKAGELGNVERIDERWDGDEYELTISVAE